MFLHCIQIQELKSEISETEQYLAYTAYKLLAGDDHDFTANTIRCYIKLCYIKTSRNLSDLKHGVFCYDKLNPAPINVLMRVMPSQREAGTNTMSSFLTSQQTIQVNTSKRTYWEENIAVIPCSHSHVKSPATLDLLDLNYSPYPQRGRWLQTSYAPKQ